MVGRVCPALADNRALFAGKGAGCSPKGCAQQPGLNNAEITCAYLAVLREIRTRYIVKCKSGPVRLPSSGSGNGRVTSVLTFGCSVRTRPDYRRVWTFPPRLRWRCAFSFSLRTDETGAGHCSRSCRQSTRWLSIARHAPVRVRPPSEPRAPQASNFDFASSMSWVHSLKENGLRKTRRSSGACLPLR